MKKDIINETVKRLFGFNDSQKEVVLELIDNDRKIQKQALSKEIDEPVKILAKNEDDIILMQQGIKIYQNILKQRIGLDK